LVLPVLAAHEIVDAAGTNGAAAIAMTTHGVTLTHDAFVGKDLDALKLMIRTRTLKADDVHALFRAAVQAAYEKISDAQERLAVHPTLAS